MIINCDHCGRSTSNRLEKCPYCQMAVARYQQKVTDYSPREMLFHLKHTSIRKV